MVHEKYNVKKLLALKKKTGKPIYVYCEDFRIWVEVKYKYLDRMDYKIEFYVDELKSGLYIQIDKPYTL